MKNHPYQITNGPASPGSGFAFSIRNEAEKQHAEIDIFDVIGKDWWSDKGVDAVSFRDQFDKIPKDREILVRINSMGGNVFDGIAIYTQLRNRRDKVTCYVIGAAVSIASVIALGGGKVKMAKAAMFMIHDPSTIAYGTVADMEKAIAALESCKASIMTAYRDKTGKPEAELSQKMTDETWFTGEEAKEYGFADEVTDDAPVTNSNNIDFSKAGFRRVPEALLKQPTALKGGDKNRIVMEKDEIIALLKECGETVDDKSTVEQLRAQLKAAFAKNKSQPAPNKDSDDAVTRIKALEDRLSAERTQRITDSIDQAIADRRIPVAQRKTWLERAIKDESVLADIQAFDPQLPPAGVSRVECKFESINDIAKHAKILNQEVSQLGSTGRSADEDRLIDAQRSRAKFLNANRERIVQVWNEGTNTIDSDLKQDVLLMDALSQFKKIILPLTMFTKNIGSVGLRGTTTIRVPYIPIDTTTSTTWNASNGYVGGDTAVEERSLALTRYYKAIRFTADELARQPFLMLNETFGKAAEQLAYDVWLGFLAVITAANYNTTVSGAATSGVPTGFPMAAAAFDTNVIADLRNSANKSQWPITGRVLIVNSDYDVYLMKDNAIKNAQAAGNNAVITEGNLTRIFGFGYGTNPNWPTNSENLVGCIAQENAVLIGASPIAPTQEELRAGLIYRTVSDPDVGITLEYKDFGQPQMNRAFRIIEANWAAGKGNEKNLYRLTSA